MNVVGSVMTEQGVTFAVVQVHAFTIETAADAEEALRSYGALFPGMPVVLMAVSGSRPARFWGRSDLANYMARVNLARVPWRSYKFRAA